MRVQTEEWRRFIPGVRMYKGKKTLFWNGEILWDDDDLFGHPLIYDEEERDSWEVIIVLPGVEVIPQWAFCTFEKLEAVIMSDTVRRIEDNAFDACESLMFVKLLRNLEYIGREAFPYCKSLTSIFIPQSCRDIGRWAFWNCTKLIIFNVPRQTQLGDDVIAGTALIHVSQFETSGYGSYNNIEVHEWVKNLNQGEDYELHRACSSFNPLKEIIYGILKRKGPSAFQKKNEVGLTPSDYLDSNPFAEIHIDQKALMKQYVMEMMGETVFNVM
ncbi:hypothetical protein CTEN210_06647 [Chaetoceros tenuissimus]|uniref:Leucine-rich repeat domain-containing protein n=1 Tax=Chaetoceros tenuissimus TaxID=426638 RepID=A0AAD3CQ84_9STRA|nr:hypothetical protein CTEN210_06647 [Chaetoceros tenuissimus]